VKLRARASAAARWGGLALCIAIAALWLASGWWAVSIVNRADRRIMAVNVDQRAIVFVVIDLPPLPSPVFDRSPGFGVRLEPPVPQRPRGFRTKLARAGQMWPRQPRWGWAPARYSSVAGPGPPIRVLIVNLWVIFLAAALPTALLWFRRRRIPPGHCRACRYNLAGITGVCPECGAEP
jgi:hypothetical protein